MYQLTISFETKEELVSYLQGSHETAAPVAPVNVEIKTAPAKGRAKPAAKPAQVLEAAPVVAEMPLSSPAPVQAVAQPTPASVGVDRDAFIGNVRKTVADLKTACNISDGVIQNIFSDINVTLGTSGVKVSELTDDKLVSFHKLFVEKAQTFFNATTAQASNASAFI